MAIKQNVQSSEKSIRNYQDTMLKHYSREMSREMAAEELDRLKRYFEILIKVELRIYGENHE
jgi:hypothetical protein